MYSDYMYTHTLDLMVYVDMNRYTCYSFSIIGACLFHGSICFYINTSGFSLYRFCDPMAIVKSCHALCTNAFTSIYEITSGSTILPILHLSYTCSMSVKYVKIKPWWLTLNPR